MCDDERHGTLGLRHAGGPDLRRRQLRRHGRRADAAQGSHDPVDVGIHKDHVGAGRRVQILEVGVDRIAARLLDEAHQGADPPPHEFEQRQQYAFQTRNTVTGEVRAWVALLDGAALLDLSSRG